MTPYRFPTPTDLEQQQCRYTSIFHIYICTYTYVFYANTQLMTQVIEDVVWRQTLTDRRCAESIWPLHACMHIHTYVCIYLWKSNTCIRIYMYTYVYIRMYVLRSTYVCIYIRTYIYFWKSNTRLYMRFRFNIYVHERIPNYFAWKWSIGLKWSMTYSKASIHVVTVMWLRSSCSLWSVRAALH